MGKYMKKPKPKSEPSSPNSSTTITNSTPPPPPPPPTNGVRTRARTLALQNSNPQNQDLSSVSNDSYLQLRSRRLRKPPIGQHSAKRNKVQNGNPKSPIGDSIAQEKTVEKSPEPAENAEFGENAGDTEARASRSSRETTPVHLIMPADAIRPPCSITRRTTYSTGAYRRTAEEEATTNSISREFEEFFAKHEAEQQREFMEKYNFDPVTEQPLPGRYEWEKLSP